LKRLRSEQGFGPHTDHPADTILLWRAIEQATLEKEMLAWA